MRILISFINGDSYWHDKVLKNAAKGSAILSDPAFLDKVEAHTGFDFCTMPARAVRDKIERAGDVKIKVGFYRGWWWSKAIASESDGVVSFNTRKDGYGAGSVGNIVHETLHALNFSHNGNSAAGNQNTVPYWIGNLAETWVIKPAPTTTKLEVEAVAPS
jgi:hypothetical protein